MTQQLICAVLTVLLLLGPSVLSEVSVETGRDSCANNFFAMEQSLLQSTEKRFNLLKAFFPPREAHPVVVVVSYTFEDLTNDSRTWFWSESEFYLIQPLEILQFTSLLFSNMPYRRRQLSIELPLECSWAPEEYFLLLTTRLKLYVQSSTTGTSAGTQRVTDSYTAVATSWTEISADALHSEFVKVWLHITVVLFPLMTWLLLYICDPVQLLLGDRTWTKLEDEHTHGTVAALIQISAIFAVYVFVVDVLGVYYTITSDFISYNTNASIFYLSTVTGLLVDIGAVMWVVFVLATSSQCGFSSFFECLRGDNTRGSTRMKRLISTVLIAPLLCIANHLLYIVISFISDPFHAGSIAIIYTFSFFVYFFIFRQFYNRVALQLNKRPPKVRSFKVCSKCAAQGNRSLLKKATTVTVGLIDANESMEEDVGGRSDERSESGVMGGSKCNCFIPGPGNSRTPFKTRMVLLSLVTVGPLVTVYEAIMIILFFNLPISKSLEDAPSKLYSIYQGTGLIIVGLLTYNIVLNPNPFSFPKTLERLAKRFRLPETTNYWNRLSDEEKCAKVIVTLLEKSLRKPLVPDDEEGDDDDDDGGEGVESAKDLQQESSL